ncbi:hypothetical protein [Bifidobacterium pseudolongum]|uniref:Uncharacterized protein n=1 Tax=Bifidobacterium pseudolongum subsp. globosum TaxID=1690 RepID=A0A4Q5ATV9_9BIFI|nr:hypothetical protein [Bifidobacterium pseudolongum]RYQ36318.1 hypothetical protein PG2003B_1155 [Bifidobacterium pseudolongum subsp. globosum]
MNANTTRTQLRDHIARHIAATAHNGWINDTNGDIPPQIGIDPDNLMLYLGHDGETELDAVALADTILDAFEQYDLAATKKGEER